LDNEYILIIQLPNQYKIYRVYAPNEKIALQRYINMCTKFMSTDNNEHRQYWQTLKDAALNKDYIIYQSNDFLGVREIL